MPVSPLVEYKISTATALEAVRDEAAYERYQKHWEHIDLDKRDAFDKGFDAGVAALHDCRTCLNRFETPKHCRSTHPCVEGSQWKYYRVEPLWEWKYYRVEPL